MSEQDKTTLVPSENEAIAEMAKSSGFSIMPCETAFDFEDRSRFSKLEFGSTQQIELSALMHHVPSIAAAGAMAQAYVVKFPAGLPHTLTALKQGGWGTMIRENGRFVGTASLYNMTAQGIVLGAFTAMSIASSQYFLAKINQNMQMMRLKLDEILEFLYGEKKSELMAEMSFVRYAYQNFQSIMTHEYQRMATIGSLQEAKKVAIKDIEFYVYDLERTVSARTKDYADLQERTGKAFQIKESLELSQQLYVMSSMMEAYYAQNLDPEYLKALEGDMLIYIDKCDKRLLASFSTLRGHIGGYKAKPMEKVDKTVQDQQIGQLIDRLNDGEESDMRKTVRSVLHAASKPAEFYLTNQGVYVKQP